MSVVVEYSAMVNADEEIFILALVIGQCVHLHSSRSLIGKVQNPASLIDIFRYLGSKLAFKFEFSNLKSPLLWPRPRC